MSKLSDTTDASLKNLLGNQVLTRPIVAITTGGGAATIKTTNAVVFTVDGVIYNLAALATQSVAVTHDERGNAYTGYTQPVLTTVYYVVGVNAAGTICVVQGTYAGQAAGNDPTVGVGPAYNLGTTFKGTGNLPNVPAGYTAFAVLKVALAGSATFVPGTTNLDATNVTVTYFDVSRLPSTNV